MTWAAIRTLTAQNERFNVKVCQDVGLCAGYMVLGAIACDGRRFGLVCQFILTPTDMGLFYSDFPRVRTSLTTASVFLLQKFCVNNQCLKNSF
jgi:hypothetical protein